VSTLEHAISVIPAQVTPFFLLGVGSHFLARFLALKSFFSELGTPHYPEFAFAMKLTDATDPGNLGDARDTIEIRLGTKHATDGFRFSFRLGNAYQSVGNSCHRQWWIEELRYIPIKVSIDDKSRMPEIVPSFTPRRRRLVVVVTVADLDIAA